MSASVYGFLCQCCKRSGFQIAVPFVEPDLGLVCEDCKLQLRFALRRLKAADFRVCTQAGDIHERRALIPVSRKDRS